MAYLFLDSGDKKNLEDVEIVKSNIVSDTVFNECNRQYRNALASDNREEQIKWLIQISELEFANQRYEQSVVSSEKAKELFDLEVSIKKNTFESEIWFRIAEGYEYTNQHDKSGRAYETCYNAAKQQENAVILSRLDMKMGNFRQFDGDTLGALMYYKKGVSHLSPSNIEQRKKYFAAEYEYFDLAMKYKSPYKTEKSLSTLCEKISQEYNKLKEYKSLLSEKFMFKSLVSRCQLNLSNENIVLPSLNEIKKYTPNPTVFQSQLNLYTELALKQGNLSLAHDFNDLSWSIAQKENNLSLKIQSLQLRKSIFFANKNYLLAYEIQEKLLPLEKKLLLKERALYINRMEKAITEKKKKKELLILIRVNRI